MIIEFLTSKFFFVVPMAIGGLMFLTLVRFVSLGTGITRAEAKKGIRDGNMAVAIYFGSRILGCALVVGALALAGTSV